MASFTSLSLASLLCCFLVALQLSQAAWTPPKWNSKDSKGIVKKWVKSKADDAELARVMKYYKGVRNMHSSPPGKYQCVVGEEYLIHSRNYPKDYPRGTKQRWIFKTDSDTLVKVQCPAIRIMPSRHCKRDKLVIFGGNKFIRGVRRCGRINNYKWTFYENLKITFKSNGDTSTSKGFICTVRCEGLPTTTTSTTTTTFSPLCPQPAFPPSVPTPVASCSDIPAEFSSACTCTDCSGKMSLTCNFCNRCDFDLFALLDFSLDIVLEPHFPCAETMDASGYFFHNSAKVKAVRICVEEDMSHVSFPLAELVNLETLAYQDCSGGPLIDICSLSRSIIPEGPKSSVKPSTRATHSVTLPNGAAVPNLVNLYLHDVILTIAAGTLGYNSLQFISMDSEDIEIQANAFSHMTALHTLSAKLCQSLVANAAFKITATNLETLTIHDTCVHTISPGSIQLEGVTTRTSHGLITLTFTASSALFPHIPMCPFRQLLEMDVVDLIWTTEVQCRSCGGVWYWSLSPGEVANITSTCYDIVSSSSMTLSTYITSNPNPCGYSFGYTSCY
ncbi:uncharacterized protein [Macrobrachium rosenbergii]|uniref:uncharacterized protein n=1 Tax=Macrobrachium rosenbergii TaxID=79674 RepID=UPI0034D4D924